MNKILMIILTAILAFSPAASWAEETKIGVFDFDRVSRQTAEGQRIQNHLKEFQATKKVELDAKEKELKDLQDHLVSQGLSLSPEKRGALQKDLQKKQNELQVVRESAQREFQIEFSEAREKFQDAVVNAVTQIGREGNYAVILESGQCVFRGDAVDITPQVIERLNKVAPPQKSATDETTHPPASKK